MTGLTARLAVGLLGLVAVTVLIASTLGGVAGLVIGGALALVFAWFGGRDVARRARELERVLRSGLAAPGAGPRIAWQRPRDLARLAASVNGVAQEMRERLGDAASEQERLRAVLIGMVEGVLVLDAEGRVFLANARLRELFDAWGDVEGRTALEVIRRDDVDRAIRAARQGEAIVEEISLPGGRYLEMHAIRFPEQGETLGTVAVFHDVTEIRRLEGMRREFVANVSHELRTPLTAIRGFTETLLGTEMEPERRRQQLEVIQRHAERLAALIEDLLALSRIEAQHAPVEPLAVDVPALCTHVLRDLKPRFEDRRIACHFEPVDVRPASADPRALEQVLVNLLDNALKYTDPGGNIRIRIHEDAARLRIEISDDGMGIPSRDLGRIFERFYRVDKARSRDLGGTGLGLAIAKHLLQAMGGDVFVESAEGEGTTMSLVLPLADPA